MLVKTANKFRSEFHIIKGDMMVNGKSIMGVMMLAAEFGSELELVLEGADSEYALETIVRLIESGFGENV
jgi:phosphocarrier protein